MGNIVLFVGLSFVLVGNAAGQRDFCKDGKCELQEKQFKEIVENAYKRGHKAGWVAGYQRGYSSASAQQGITYSLPPSGGSEVKSEQLQPRIQFVNPSTGETFSLPPGISPR